MLILSGRKDILNKQESQVTKPRFAITQVSPTATPAPSLAPAPKQYALGKSRFAAQTFNNCGPATLSMVLSLYGVFVSQEELRFKMRPFSNLIGGNDDKSIFTDEFARYAKEYGLEAFHRPNGTIEILKKFVSNNIPVVVRTWLHSYDDIGHFRIVRGYTEETRTILQDDSYQGANISFHYDEFNKLWQPFNYGYIVVYPKEKQGVVDAILAEEKDELTAWRNALKRAEKELRDNPDSYYSLFNLSTASYYAGDYQKSVDMYEKAKPKLPSKMLWYQIEPVQAYAKLERHEKVFGLTDQILQNGNLAYSELYQIRGEVYFAQGKKDEAKKEFEKAMYYNKNFTKAKEYLEKISHGE